jgi:glucose 1-dehydrogenase (FAD, quinone)
MDIPVIHHLPGVGQNLQNHVATYLNFILKEDTAKNYLDWASAMEYMLKRTGRMSSTGLSQMTGILNSKYAEPSGLHPDLQFFFSGYTASCSRTGEINESAHPEDPHTKSSIRYDFNTFQSIRN